MIGYKWGKGRVGMAYLECICLLCLSFLSYGHVLQHPNTSRQDDWDQDDCDDYTKSAYLNSDYRHYNFNLNMSSKSLN